MELELLKLLSIKDAYVKYSPYIKADRLTPDVADLFKSLDDFYNETGLQGIVWDTDFYTWYTTLKHPSLENSKLVLIKQICATLAAQPVPSDAVLNTFMFRDVAAQIADMGTHVVDGTKTYDLQDFEDLLLGYKANARVTNQFLEGERVSSNNIADQLEDLKVGEKFSWRLTELEISLGPIKRGDFIIVGARPDSGKTTFLASEATYMASQLDSDDCVLWFNNEEELSRVVQRQVQAALEWDYAEVSKDVQLSQQKFFDALGGDKKLITYDDSNMSVSDIDRAVELYNPKIIIIDQLWKLRGYEKESTSEVDRFARVASHLRTLAKQQGPVITTSQLDGSADGTKFPDMNALYNSKTAVQGEADAILMIGREGDTAPPNERWLKAPKNKLPFGVPRHRNSGWCVDINPDKARFESKTKEPRPPVT